MRVLVKEEALRDFLTALGISSEALAQLDHEELLGFASAVLDYQAHAASNPDRAQTYGHDGYTAGCKSLADSGGVHPGDLAVRLAQQGIGRMLGQIRQLDPPAPGTPRLIEPALSLLFGAGVLLELTKPTPDPTRPKRAVRIVQDCIVRARGALDDAKHAMRAQGINL